MSIATNHRLGLMTNPAIDNPLVNTSCGAIRTERVAEDVPATRLVPFGVSQRVLKVRHRFITGKRSEGCSALAAAAHFKLVKKRIRAARMILEPLSKNVGEKKGERHPTSRVLAADTFSLANADHISLKVNVVEPRPHHFAAPSTGMGGKDKYRINERMASALLDGGEQIINFRQREKQGIPKLFLLGFAQPASNDLSFYFRPGLKWRFLIDFRKSKAAFRQRFSNNAGFLSPTPDRRQRGQFLLNRRCADILSPEAGFP